MDDILNATLAGGVVVGGACQIFTNPAGSLVIGIFAGIVSCLGFRYLQAKLEKSIGLYDSCGVLNLHGIPGVLGGIFTAIAVAAYNSSPINDTNVTQYLQFYPNPATGLNMYGRNFLGQGGIQIAAIFISLGIGIGFGIIAGLVIRLYYSFQPQDFYRDDIYF
jgi:ammonium transporter Rh